MANKGIGTRECPEHGEYYLDAEDSPCPGCEDGVPDLEPINVGTKDDPLWWSEGLCEDCMNEDGTKHCSCGCFACADCMTEHAHSQDGGIRHEILASPEAMRRRAAHNTEWST